MPDFVQTERLLIKSLPRTFPHVKHICPILSNKHFRLCVYVVIPFILDVSLVDLPAGVTQEEGHTGFLHLPFAVLALTFLARRIQPSSLSVVDREVEFCVVTS